MVLWKLRDPAEELFRSEWGRLMASYCAECLAEVPLTVASSGSASYGESSVAVSSGDSCMSIGRKNNHLHSE